MNKKEVKKIIKEKENKIMSTDYITCSKCGFVIMINSADKKKQVIDDIKKICNKIVHHGSGDIAYGKLFEELNKLQKRK